MTPEQLEEIKKLAEAATPGPWVWRGPSSDDPADLWTADGKDAIVCVQTTNADVKFIRAMREHVLPLIEALEEAMEDARKHREDALAWMQVSFAHQKERDEARAEVERLRSALRLLWDQACDHGGAFVDETCDAVEAALKEGE